ncbi:MAG: ABC transporter ATP-binding protein [Propionibacteriaceae bacterium]
MNASRGPALATRALTKTFGPTTALAGIDLEVAPGTVFGLIGPNGAGKTTTMRILLDLVRPTSGEAEVLGVQPRSGGPALRRRIGYLPGELALQGRVSGRSLLAHYASISGPVAPGRVDQLAERLGLDLDRQVRTLSKGNKQKLGLVQAFLHEPELLVLDEPTSGLDPLVQQEFLTMVREARDAGQTVLLSSHVLSEIEQAADTVAILRAGRIISASDVATLRRVAIREIRASIADATPDEVGPRLRAVPGVSDLEIRPSHDGVRVTATVEGHLDALVKTLASYRITDLVATEPDLEQAVLRLYTADPETTGGSTGGAAAGSAGRSGHAPHPRHAGKAMS